MSLSYLSFDLVFIGVCSWMVPMDVKLSSILVIAWHWEGNIWFFLSMITKFSDAYPKSCVTMGLLPDTQNCVWACAGNAGNVFPPPLVSDPDMHQGTCVTHAPWCMSGSLTSGFLWSPGDGENVPGIPGACATGNFTYLVRGPWWHHQMETIYILLTLCASNPLDTSEFLQRPVMRSF